MKKNKIVKLARQLISFGFVGGIITGLSLVIYWICVYIGIHYEIANAIGFAITVALAYVLNNKFTFSERKEKIVWSWKALMKTYASYALTGLLLASVLLWIWTNQIGINENIAPLLNLFFTIPINFLLNKFWIFKGRSNEKLEDK